MRDAPPWYAQYTDGNNRQIKLDIAVGAQMDMTAAADAVLVNTGKLPHSVPSQLWDGNVSPNNYALFARGGWETMPVRTIITPDAQTSPQAGVVSDVISDSGREIDWEMNIAFTRQHKSGLTFYFQDGMIAEDFDIIVDDAIIQTDGGGDPGGGGNAVMQWSIASGVLSISSSIADQKVIIPDYAEGAAPWYNQRFGITAINLSQDVAGIGTNAFYGLEELVTVQSLGGSMYISAGGFKSCVKLPDITIPDTMGEIFGTAFDGCLMLAHVLIEGHPQVYAGAFSMGTYDKIVESVIEAPYLTVSDTYGNRYTKLWQDALGSTPAYDTFDNCFRIFGAGVFTPPTVSASNYFYAEEMLIFGRITQINNTSGASQWPNYCRVGSVYLGDGLNAFNLVMGNEYILSLRNGLNRPRSFTGVFSGSVNMTGGVNISSAFNGSFLNCKKLTDVIISAPEITTENGGVTFYQMFGGADGISSLTGIGCENNVLYGRSAATGPNDLAFLHARDLGGTGELVFRAGTTTIYPYSTGVYQATINVGTLDIPSSVGRALTILGDADTVILRCSRNYIPMVSCRRLYCTYLGTDTATSSTNNRKNGDMKLQILDLVGGSVSGDAINSYFIVNCPNIQEVRVRSAASTTYCRLDFINNAAPLITYNCYTVSGTPYNSATYTRFVRVGAPPPIEVS